SRPSEKPAMKNSTIACSKRPSSISHTMGATSAMRSSEIAFGSQRRLIGSGPAGSRAVAERERAGAAGRPGSLDGLEQAAEFERPPQPLLAAVAAHAVADAVALHAVDRELVQHVDALHVILHGPERGHRVDAGDREDEGVERLSAG